MKVILTEDVASLGGIGSIVQVKNGYARNYLIPRSIAVMADESNKKGLAHKQKILAVKKARILSEHGATAKRLESLKLQFLKAVGEEDRIFGTVTSSEIADAILAASALKIDKKSIHVEDIKKLGQYTASVKLHADVSAQIQITVKKLETQAAAE